MKKAMAVVVAAALACAALAAAPTASAGTFDNNVQGSVNGQISAVDEGIMGGAGTQPDSPGTVVCCSYEGNPPMTPEVMQWAPDGRSLALYAEKTDGSGALEIWIYDQVDNTLRNLHVIADRLSRPSFSPSSKQIAVAQNGDIGVFDVGSGQLVRWVATGAAVQTHPSWSPDNADHIAYEAPDGVREVPATGGTSVLRISGAAKPYYAPNGKDLAYTRDGKLWISDRFGQGERATNLSATDYVWSPDSQFFLGTFAEGTYEQGWTADLMQVTTTGEPVEGVWSTPTTFSWRPIPPPTVAMIKPGNAWSTTTRLVASWRATDDVSIVTTKDVRYRRTSVAGAVSSGFVQWRTGTTANTGAVEVTPGATYCFSARARNEYDAVSKWTADVKCTSVPTDDRSLAASGPWLRGASSPYLAATYTSTTKQGATLISSTRAVSTVGVLALTCPSCGRVRVSIGGVVVGTISLTSITSARRLVFLPKLVTQRQGKVTLTVVSSGKLVRIDGLATSRS